MWSFGDLTSREEKFTQRAIEALSDVSWAKPLLNRLHRAGGLKTENLPLMFEVRFAFELHRTGLSAVYEHPAGVRKSTVDFQVKTSTEWLIELVSIRPSAAIKRATHRHGPISAFCFSPDSNDRHQSENAEMILTEQKIGEKVFVNGLPTKFPLPGNAIHLIVTDVRGFLARGGDIGDYRQMAYGPRGIPQEKAGVIKYWEEKAIKGLFERENPLPAGRYIQERIHFLGFIREENFREGEICDVGYYLASPHFFSSQKEAREAFKTYPLKSLTRSAVCKVD